MTPDQTRAARDIVGLYTRRGLDWERGRGRSLFEKPWLDRLLARKAEDPECGRHTVWLARKI